MSIMGTQTCINSQRGCGFYKNYLLHNHGKITSKATEYSWQEENGSKIKEVCTKYEILVISLFSSIFCLGQLLPQFENLQIGKLQVATCDVFTPPITQEY